MSNEQNAQEPARLSNALEVQGRSVEVAGVKVKFIIDGDLTGLVWVARSARSPMGFEASWPMIPCT